jgi:Ca2+-transporting ATPase
VAAFAQLFFAIGCRSDRVTAFGLGFFKNPALLLAILLSGLLQVVIVTLPHTRSVFEIEQHLSSDWAFVIALALVPVTVIEVAKWAAAFAPLPTRDRSIDRPAVRP